MVILSPGDIIRISSDWKVPADIVLLKGSAVCNESGLTGESMPVSKIPGKPDSDAEFGTKGANKFTLFAGTKVLQAGSSADEIVYGKVMVAMFKCRRCIWSQFLSLLESVRQGEISLAPF